jgi:flavin-dependent dehydrogenase
MTYDIAIIGLGPAGSTLARLLPGDLKVIAVDKKSDECRFKKPCGGLLAPDAQRILSKFELTLPKSILADPQIFSVRTIDVKSGITRQYPRFYMNMDRHKFDLWLMSLIPGRVEVRYDTVTSLVREGELWHVKCGGDTIRAKYVVGADGANSLVRRTVFPNVGIRTYTSIQQGFATTGIEPTGQYICVFDPDTTDCYAWGVSKDDVFVFGGAFPKHNARMHFDLLKAKMPPFGYNLDTPLYTEACLVLRPATPLQFAAVNGNAFLIGEAAGFISPSSLEGISHAMNSALLLSEAFRTANPVRAYSKSTHRIKRNLSAKLLKCPFMYSPVLRRTIMKSKLRSIK